MAHTLGGLKQRREFLQVAAARRKWAAPGLVLQARVRGERDRPAPGRAAPPDIRVGFTASRKVGGAVIRNRARRRLRQAVRQVMPDHAAPGQDYVVIARATTVRRRFSDLVNDLEMALKRLDAWRDDDKETAA